MPPRRGWRQGRQGSPARRDDLDYDPWINFRDLQLYPAEGDCTKPGFLVKAGGVPLRRGSP